MRVFVANGSPMGDRGNTWFMLEHFIRGLREGGAEVDVAHLVRHRIAHCTGEFHCWTHDGLCIHRDDMDELLPLVGAADTLVLATPLYVDGMSSILKQFVDRMIPLVSGGFELRDGHCRHPRLSSPAGGRLVLVSNCGFWEMDNFDALAAHAAAIAKNLDSVFAGALLRPHGPALRVMHDRGLPVQDVLDALAEAGRQLALTGSMGAEVLAVVSRPLLPLDMYVDIVNGHRGGGDA